MSIQMFANIQTKEDHLSVSLITRPTDRESATAEELLFAKEIIEAFAHDPKAPKIASIRIDSKATVKQE